MRKLTLLVSQGLISLAYHRGKELIHLVIEEYQASGAVVQCVDGRHWTFLYISLVTFRTILYRYALSVDNIMVLTFAMLKAVFDQDLLNCEHAGQDVGFLTA